MNTVAKIQINPSITILDMTFLLFCCFVLVEIPAGPSFTSVPLWVGMKGQSRAAGSLLGRQGPGGAVHAFPR